MTVPSRASRPLRFLVIGAWNTVFGFAAFALLFRFTRPWEVHFVWISLVSNVLAVSNAYLGYKLFVFRTKGDWLGEYVRFWMSYALTISIHLGSLWLAVTILGMHPILAQALILLAATFISYFAHSRFSFRGGSGGTPGPP